jgi:Co/Zn/Cd efflux system component
MRLGGPEITAVAQAAVVAISGSVALPGDTLHNFADALTAIPLAIAFLLGRRPVASPTAWAAAKTSRANAAAEHHEALRQRSQERADVVR